MKKLAANVFAIVGGAWTSLCGILFLGLLWSIAEDPTVLSGSERTYFVSPLLGSALLMMVGIGMFWSGLRLMKSANQISRR
jgi:hypothetical protein